MLALRARPNLLPLTVLTVIAALPRIVLENSAPVFLYPDSATYANQALQLIGRSDGTGLPWQSPGYSALVALSLLLAPDRIAPVVVLQHGLALVTVCLTFLIGAASFNRWVGFWAGAALAVSAPQLTYEQAIVPDSILVLLLALFVSALQRATQPATPRALAGMAATAFATAALHPIGTALLPVAALVGLRHAVRRWHRMVWIVVLFAASLLAFLAFRGGATDTAITAPVDLLPRLHSFYSQGELTRAELWSSHIVWADHPALAVLAGPATFDQQLRRAVAERALTLYRPERYGLGLVLLALAGLLLSACSAHRALAYIPGSLALGLAAVQILFGEPSARSRNALEPLLLVAAIGGVAATLSLLSRAIRGPNGTLAASTRGRVTRCAATALALGVLVTSRFWQLDRFDPSSFGNSFDEGIRLEQLLLMTMGFKPFVEIYASQGPLLLDFLYPWFVLFGQTVLSARIPVALASLVCLLAVLLIGRALGSTAAGAIAALLLGLSAGFLDVSRFSLAEVPSMAPALMSLWLLIRCAVSGLAIWSLALSGLLFGAALVLKPMIVITIFPLATLLAVPWRTDPSGDRPWRWTWLRSRAERVAIWGAFAAFPTLLALATIGPSPLYEQFIAYRQGAVGLGALGQQHWSLETNFRQIWLIVRLDQPLLLLAIASLPILLIRRWRIGLIASGWLGCTLVALLLYSPLSNKHVAYLFPPLALLAGGGVALSLQCLRATAQRSRVAVTLVTLSAGWLLFSIQPTATHLIDALNPRTDTTEPESDLSHVLAEIRGLREGLVITDHSYLAYLGRQAVPPWLVDISRTRIAAGALTDEEVIQQTEQYRPAAVVYWAGRLSMLRGFSRWLQSEYGAEVHYERNRALYLRRDLQSAETAQARLAESLGFITYGRLFELHVVEMGPQRQGSAYRVTFGVRALSAIQPGLYSVQLELLDARGERVLSQIEPLMPPWLQVPLVKDTALRSRRWLDLRDLPDAEYVLHAAVLAGRDADILPGTLAPGGSFSADSRSGSIQVTRLTLPIADQREPAARTR